jgi:hypothetical protein
MSGKGESFTISLILLDISFNFSLFNMINFLLIQEFIRFKPTLSAY